MLVKRSNLVICCLLVISIFIFNIGKVNASEYINYYGISMNDEEYDNLLNLGFTSDEIYYMNEETFENNKNIESSLVVRNERYYKTIYTGLNGEGYSNEITKEEYDNQSGMNTRGTVNTTYKKMISTISENGSKFRYKVTVAWKQMPSTRSYDIIGIGHDNTTNIYISSGVFFNYYYCYSDSSCTTSTMYFDKNNLSTGGSVVYKVPSDDIRELSSALYYDVAKSTSSTITELNMCGDYSHATTAYSSGYTDHTVNINGISLGSTIAGYYDEIPCALSTWYGSW